MDEKLIVILENLKELILDRYRAVAALDKLLLEIEGYSNAEDPIYKKMFVKVQLAYYRDSTKSDFERRELEIFNKLIEVSLF
jgi:hypothetical protein